MKSKKDEESLKLLDDIIDKFVNVEDGKYTYEELIREANANAKKISSELFRAAFPTVFE